MKNKGKFIVFEGIDGSGKTTISKLFLEYLKNKNFKCFYTYEPNVSSYGIEIRKLLKENKNINKKDAIEYFMKDRKWHIDNVIKLNLELNDYIICDRYYYSTCCYQSDESDFEEILKDNENNFLIPDLTFLMDVDVDTAIKRIENNRNYKTSFEKKEVLSEVRKKFLNIKRKEYFIINGENEISQVLSNVIKKFEEIENE